MKALSLKQPYANWVVGGHKTIETRKWKINFRGRILIVSSLNKGLLWKDAYNLQDWVLKRLPPQTGEWYPLGCALATVRIVNCRPMTKADEKAAMCDLYEGAYAWDLADLRGLDGGRRLEDGKWVKCSGLPFGMKGSLGLFNADFEEDGPST